MEENKLQKLTSPATMVLLAAMLMVLLSVFFVQRKEPDHKNFNNDGYKLAHLSHSLKKFVKKNNRFPATMSELQDFNNPDIIFDTQNNFQYNWTYYFTDINTIKASREPYIILASPGSYTYKNPSFSRRVICVVDSHLNFKVKVVREDTFWKKLTKQRSPEVIPEEEGRQDSNDKPQLN